MKYWAKIKKQKDSSFLVTFPGLIGCVTDGDTLSEAKAMAYDALNIWLSAMCQAGDQCKIPRPRKRSGENYYPVDVDTRACRHFA